MGKLIHIGFGNVVNTGKIIAIVSPDSAPVKRMVQKAKETGMAIDATQVCALRTGAGILAIWAATASGMWRSASG